MPCQTYSDSELSSMSRRELSNVTSLLCYVVHRVRQGHSWLDIEKDHPALRAWVAEHDARDQERLKAEAATAKAKRDRAAAIAKLTPAERAALGLNETF